MTIKDDIEEVKRLMDLRDDTEYKLTCAMAKITVRLTDAQVREVLAAFDIIRLNVDGVLVPTCKSHWENWRAA